jgi:hypothetical protein
LTDLANTPMGRQGALSPVVVASALVRRLAETADPGRVTLLESFPAMEPKT